MNISVVMVLGDEDMYFDRALKSVKEIADEIIICDTGFCDSTHEISRKSSKIKVTKGHKDSSVIQNEGIKEAEGKWVLTIDAKEELKVKKEELIKKLEHSECEAYYIKINTFIDTIDEMDKLIQYQVRLFKNGYKHIIEAIGDKDNTPKLDFITGEIENYSYLNKSSLKRSIELWPSKDKEGITRYLLGDYDRAIICLLDTWQFCINKQQQGLEAALFLVRALIEQDRYEQGLEFISRAIGMLPESTDMHYYRGVAYLGLNKIPEAIDSFAKSKNCKQGAIPLPTFEGTGGYKANYMLGLVYQNLDKHNKAVDGFLATIKEKKDHLDAMDGLVHSFRELGDTGVVIRRKLEEYLLLDRIDYKTILAKSLYSNGLYKDALEVCEGIKGADLELVKSKCLINIGKTSDAKEILKSVTPEKEYYEEALLELALLYLIIDKDNQSKLMLKKLSLLGWNEKVEIMLSIIDGEELKDISNKNTILDIFKRIVETRNVQLFKRIETIIDLDDQLSYYYLIVGDYLEKIQQYYLAVDWYRKGLQRGYISFKSAITLGEYALEAGEYNISSKLIKRALQLNPYHYKPYKRLAQLHLIEADLILKEAKEITVDGDYDFLKMQTMANAIELISEE